MKILIVEDEKIAAQFIETMLLDNFKDFEIVGTANNIQKAKDIYLSTKPDLLIMDINLGDHLSFELFDDIGSENLNVIFTTGYQEFAVSAFKVNAIDYIMKPVKLPDLKTAIEKAKERLKIRKNNEPNSVNTYLTEQTGVLTVWENEKLKTLKLTDIIKIKSERNYSSIFLTNNKEIFTSKHLGAYQELLSGSGFFRIHRSCLINVIHFVSYRPGVIAMVQLTNNQFETISRRKKEELMHILNQIKS